MRTSSTTPMSRVSPSGFTLLELLVVVVIITLMSAFVAPRMLGSLTHMNLKTSAKNIAAALRYARSLAVSEQTAYLARFDMEGGRVLISPAEDTGQDAAESEEEAATAVRVYSLPAGITLSKSEEAVDLFGQDALQIEFYADGNSSGGEVILSDERGKRYVVWADFISGTVGADVCGEDCK